VVVACEDGVVQMQRHHLAGRLARAAAPQKQAATHPRPVIPDPLLPPPPSYHVMHQE